MAKYDHIKVRVSKAERAQLQKMVDSKQASTLSDAARKRVFAPDCSNTELITKYLSEISSAHSAIKNLIFLQLENKAFYEADIIRMEKALAEMIKNAAKFVRAMRTRM